MSELLKALDAATEQDLEAVRTEIRQAEGRLSALRTIERILTSRLRTAARAAVPRGYKEASSNGQEEFSTDDAEESAPEESPEPLPRRKGRPLSQDAEARKMIAQLIAEDGPTSPAVLKNRFGFDDERLACLLSHKWFSKGANGFSVTPAAKEALNKDD